MAGDTLRQHLRRIRRLRLVLCEGVSGGSWGIIASVGLFLLAMWLDLLWEFSPHLRIASAVLAAVAAPIVWMAFGWLAISRGRGQVLARRMDRVADTGGVILTGWDLAQGPPWPSSLSMGLAELAVARAAETAGHVPAGQVISWQKSRRSMGSLLFLGAAVAALVLMMPQLARTQWRRFTAPFADQPPFSRITFHVEPGDTEVVYGNGLDIYATAAGPPIDRMEMVLVGRAPDNAASKEAGNDVPAHEGAAKGEATVVPMFPEADGRWRAVLASVTQEGDYFVRSRDARSQRYQISVITVPRIAAVRFRIVPPEYTRQGPYEGPLPQGGIEGLRGTKVTAWAASNRPLSGGLAKLTAEGTAEDLRMSPTSSSPTASGEVSASFEIRRSGKLELRVVDKAGQPSRESFVAGITLLEDQHPIIRILEPRPISLATPDVTLGVVLAAEDDYGLSRVQLFRSLNDSRPLPMDVALPPNLRRWSDVVPLPLARYGLTPGDVIKLFARAEDNDPAGAKGSESSVVTVQIISQEQYERMLQVRQGMEVLMSKYRQAQRRLESLREKKKGLEKKAREQPAGKPLADELRSELAQLAAQMAQDAAALRKAAQSPLPYDIDKNFTKHLEKLAKSLEENQRRLQRLTDLSSQSKLSPKELAEALAQMLEQDGASQLEYEQSALLPLEMLERAMPLIANQSKFVQLYRRQRELAERLLSLKGRDGQDDPALKARMRDLEAEQRRIREALDQLLADIDDRAERLPDDPKFEALRKSAKDFAKAVRESGALEAMAQAEAGLAEFSGTRGHQKAKEAADILEKFLGKCQGMGQAAGQCLVFAPGLGQGLGNTIAQLLAEMGLNPGAASGSGVGQGSGGGYSAQANTADNTGLYGNHPALDGGERKSGSGQSQHSGAGGNFAHRSQERPSTMIESSGPVGSGSGSEGSVPPNYRRRVADYFRRIGEETGGR